MVFGSSVGIYILSWWDPIDSNRHGSTIQGILVTRGPFINLYSQTCVGFTHFASGNIHVLSNYRETSCSHFLSGFSLNLPTVCVYVRNVANHPHQVVVKTSGRRKYSLNWPVMRQLSERGDLFFFFLMTLQWHFNATSKALPRNFRCI